MSKAEAEATICNRLGMHARATARFVKEAEKYQSRITVNRVPVPAGQEDVSARSILGLMILAAEQGSCIRIVAQGQDAQEAVDALAAMVENGFGELGDDHSG